jgi:hypothetical protein
MRKLIKKKGKKKKTKRTTPIMSENEEKYFKTYIKDFLLKRGTLLNLDVDILKPNHKSQSTPSEPPSSASSNTTSKEKRNEEIMKELETFIQKNNNNSASKVNIEEVFDTLFAFMKWHEDKLIELEEKRVYALHEVLASRYIEAYPITDSIITEIANNPNSPPPKEIAEQFHQFVEKEAPNLAEVSTTVYTVNDLRLLKLLLFLFFSNLFCFISLSTCKNLKSELCQYPSEKIVWKCLENTQRQKVIAEKKRLRKQNMKKLRSFSISEYDGADPKPLFRNHQGSGMIIAHFSFLSGHNAVTTVISVDLFQDLLPKP